MPDPMTPGECAYAAYHQGSPLPWALLPAYEQRNWEAAAQAVLALRPPAGADRDAGPEA